MSAIGLKEIRDEIARIRDYGEADLPQTSQSRLWALEDRVARMSAWLRNLTEDIDSGEFGQGEGS